MSDNCDRQFLAIRSHDGILVLRLVVEVKSQLVKLCRMFSYLGRDSLLAAVLSYNVGPYRLKGYGKRPKSRLLKKLESGDRNIYKEYVSFRCYKGKVVPSIERRRKVEFMLLFEE